VLGELAARGYSEPMNRWLRTLWEGGPKRLGSVIESDKTAKLEGSRITITTVDHRRGLLLI
jgi:hypothetical protein